MKRNSLIICMVLIFSLSGVAGAQVVISDAGGTAFVKIYSFTYGSTSTIGSVSFYMPTTIPFTTVFPLPPMVGYTAYITSVYINYFPFYTNVPIYVMADQQAAFEFNLGTVTFPTTMTANNFTARLNGLNVTNSYAWPTTNPGTMNVDLFDMGDVAEDGAITASDYNSTRGSLIASRTHMFSQAGTADFNNIDVTCAVRNDLFGAGQTDFSGFILKSSDSQYQLLWYDDDDATLMINPGVTGPICASGGGGGGGGGGGCFIANAAR